jgi:serine/threonine-protein kinase
MRVEAAASRGRPVSFLWIGPWTRSSREAADSVSAGGRAANIIWSAILMTLLFGGVWLARRNLRSGRGDRRGAARIAVAIALAQLCMWVLGAHHVATVDETDILANGLADMALISGFFWALYVALEPFMRRHWPRMLISWTRLLAGGWRDPLVGRDLLVGASAGALIGMLMGPVRRVIPVLLGEPPPVPRGFPGGLFSSVPSSLATLMQIPGTSLVWVLGIVMFLVLVRLVVRYEWIAALLVAILFSSNYLGTPPLYVTLPVVTFATGLLVVVAIRFGLLAALVCQICNVSLSVVMTPEPSAWYFYPGAIGIALVLALAFWGLRTSAPSTAATG